MASGQALRQLQRAAEVLMVHLVARGVYVACAGRQAAAVLLTRYSAFPPLMVSMTTPKVACLDASSGEAHARRLLKPGRVWTGHMSLVTLATRPSTEALCMAGFS